VVTTTIPVANWPAAFRNEAVSTCSLTASSARLGAP
jgi:hypothetical protein